MGLVGTHPTEVGCKYFNMTGQSIIYRPCSISKPCRRLRADGGRRCSLKYPCLIGLQQADVVETGVATVVTVATVDRRAAWFGSGMHTVDCMKTFISSGRDSAELERFISHGARAADLARLGYKAPAQWNDTHRAQKFCELYAVNADFRRMYQEARLGGDFFINLGPGIVVPGLEPKTVEQSKVTIAEMIENSSTPSVDYRPLTPSSWEFK